MNFKKFALLILTMVVISGFNAKPVSASANDNVPTEQTAETAGPVSEVSEEDKKDSEDVAEDGNGADSDTKPDSKATAASPSPKSAPAAQNAAKPAAKSAKKSYSKSDLRLMASIINCEAGAEGFQGKLAVGIVVMNRVASKNFPNTVKKVIYEKGQFSPVRNGMLSKKLKQYDAGRTKSSQWKSCISAAKKVLSGQRTIVYKGKTKSLKGYHFFSVVLPGARIKLGGHRFK
ncbi:cell wall hydrolase [bacterium 1xD8-6]|nr:cell wall hydrolase [bacterium D16-36]RKI70277.1 cell wall hydrolase [bacterium 1xD8-6]